MSRWPLDPAGVAILPSSSTMAGLPSVAAEGALCWVTGRGRFFQRLAGDWISRPELSDPAWASASLSISSAGSDDAPGTAEDPIATMAEWGERVSRLAIGQATLTLLDDLAEEDVTIAGDCGGLLDRWLYVTAAPAVLLSTTLSAVTPWNLGAASNVVGTVTGTASLVSHAGTSGGPGRLWRIVGGARDGAWGVLGAVESGSAVIFVPPVSALYAVDTVTPQAGDTVEILDPLRLASRLRVGPNTRLFLDGLQVGDAGGHDVQVGAGAALLASGCQFTGGIDALVAGFAELTGCGLDVTARAEGDGEGGGGKLSIRGCHARGIMARPGGLLALSDIVTSYQVAVASWANAQVVSGFVFADNPASAAAWTLGKRSAVDAVGVLNGRGVAASAGRVVLDRGAMLTYASKPNITGTGTEYDCGGSTGTFAGLPAANTANGSYIVAR